MRFQRLYKRKQKEHLRMENIDTNTREDSIKDNYHTSPQFQEKKSMPIGQSGRVTQLF